MNPENTESINEIPKNKVRHDRKSRTKPSKDNETKEISENLENSKLNEQENIAKESQIEPKTIDPKISKKYEIPENFVPFVYEDTEENKGKTIIRLSRTFTPTLNESEQNEYFKENSIKILGDNIPSPAITFDELKLPPKIMETVHVNSWDKPTPIQSIAIPVGLQGKDMIGIAKTGSGKTAAFLIPALCHIMVQKPMEKDDGPIVLIISPTRELAQQTDEVCREFCKRLPFNHACLFGGKERKNQIYHLKKNPAIVIATPGRLIDFIQSGVCKMNRVNFIVLDEADRMLDMGFEPQIRTIMAQVPKEREMFMFSATWPHEIRELADDFLNDPVHMQIGDNELTTNSNIKQVIEKVLESEKTDKCIDLIKENQDKKIIIFVNTKRIADSLTKMFNTKGLRVEVIHGGKLQNQRDQVLNIFRICKAGVLIATDVAARGLDVNDINMVINYDFPICIEDYVHRIGRTARGNKEGLSITFFTEENKQFAKSLVKLLNQAEQEVPDWLQATAKYAMNDDGTKPVRKIYHSRDGNGYGSEYVPGSGAYGERLEKYGSFGHGCGGPRDTPLTVLICQ